MGSGHCMMYFVITGASEEAGGFANVDFNMEHSVEGCVYAITETELAKLDNCMGYPKVGGIDRAVTVCFPFI